MTEILEVPEPNRALGKPLLEPSWPPRSQNRAVRNTWSRSISEICHDFECVAISPKHINAVINEKQPPPREANRKTAVTLTRGTSLAQLCSHHSLPLVPHDWSLLPPSHWVCRLKTVPPSQSRFPSDKLNGTEGVYNFIILLVFKFHDHRSDSLGVMKLTNDLSYLVYALCRFKGFHYLT